MHGTTWISLNMADIFTNTYHTTIPGYENCTWMTYKIVAYDNNGYQAANDNHGCYCNYHVIPEFPSFLVLPLFMSFTFIAVALRERRKIRLKVITKTT